MIWLSSSGSREAVGFERFGHFHQVESIEELLEERDPELSILASCEFSEDDHICVEPLVPDGRQSCIDLCHIMSESVKREKKHELKKDHETTGLLDILLDVHLWLRSATYQERRRRSNASTLTVSAKISEMKPQTVVHQMRTPIAVSNSTSWLALNQERLITASHLMSLKITVDLFVSVKVAHSSAPHLS